MQRRGRPGIACGHACGHRCHLHEHLEAVTKGYNMQLNLLNFTVESERREWESTSVSPNIPIANQAQPMQCS